MTTQQFGSAGDGSGGERYADDARRYRLDSRIATGGMGEVWRSTDTVLGRLVAVKILKAEYADDATFRSRFETEARNAAALHHPNVAGIFDFGQASPSDGSPSPRPYLVMELVDGQPLSALLRPDQPMDPKVVTDLMAQVADGLGAAHRAGIVHRDIKPANLLVTNDRVVKITDFGIARAGDNVALTQTGMVMGTPQYISPEQAQGSSAGPASDVYSLGIVAFECLAGKRPFIADTAVATALAHLRQPVPELPASVPSDLAAVVRRSMAKKPEERFADGTAFARALRDPSSVAAAPVTTAADGESTQVITGVGAPVPAPVPAPGPEPDSSEPETTDDEDKKKVGALPWVAGVLALILVGLIIYLFVMLGNDEGDDSTAEETTTSTSSSATETSETTSETPSETTSEPTTIDLNADDYLGRQVSDVVDELRALGLDPRPSVQENPGGEIEGTVTEVSPTSGLEEGAQVTVSYWGPEPEPEPTETETETSEPTETETETTTEPTDDAGDTGGTGGEGETTP